MDLQSIATESQTLRSTIRDLRSVITTDRERLERHEGELKAALLRLDELESDAQLAFAAIRTVGSEPPPGTPATLAELAPCAHERGVVKDDDEWRCEDCAAVIPSPFGEPEQQSAA